MGPIYVMLVVGFLIWVIWKIKQSFKPVCDQNEKLLNESIKSDALKVQEKVCVAEHVNHQKSKKLNNWQSTTSYRTKKTHDLDVDDVIEDLDDVTIVQRNIPESPSPRIWSGYEDRETSSTICSSSSSRSYSNLSCQDDNNDSDSDSDD